ncbi:MAG: 4Fe-4S dicluster domain-containing protein [Planctomycetota bacterium]
MDQGILQRSKLPALLDALCVQGAVYAPVNGDKGVAFGRITAGREGVIDGPNPVMSPKGLFFPQCETLWTFDANGVKAVVEPPAGPFTVFGLRPCDAAALVALDRVFGDEGTGFKDPYFMTRRRNGLLIVVACDRPCRTCFCTSVGGGPYAAAGADILVSTGGTELAWQACSPRGRELMRTHAAFFTAADALDALYKGREAKARTAMPEGISTDGVADKLRAGFNAKVWNTMFTRCLGCGVCTFVCPTCHCFDITDEADGAQQGRHVRAWDSCQFALFTSHASGHNPRPSKKERMRQRILHKYLYTVDNYHAIFCTGCGRCVRACPVNLDIREMITTLRNWKEPV